MSIQGHPMCPLTIMETMHVNLRLLTDELVDRDNIFWFVESPRCNLN